MILAAFGRAQEAVRAGETLDIEAEARRLVREYPYLGATVAEMADFLRWELAAAQAQVRQGSRKTDGHSRGLCA
jgi:hypothetical protein